MEYDLPRAFNLKLKVYGKFRGGGRQSELWEIGK